jgi:diphosphoinositol-polyphosphate diphosphatase
MKKKAGCVPVRRTAKGAWQVLLVESRWTQEIWLFPKGGVEKDEQGKEAAVRETREEAGVEGFLGPKLGAWLFSKSNEQRHKMWILFVTKEFPVTDKRWKERKKRQRVWMSFDEAHALLTSLPEDLVRPELAEMLNAARQTLGLVNGDGSGWRDDIAAAKNAVMASQNGVDKSGGDDVPLISASLASVTAIPVSDSSEE